MKAGIILFVFSAEDVASSKELSVVVEITSVLREWGAIWKQLFVVRD